MEYIQLIRQALNKQRNKKDGYYEAHHIIPKSFNKKSSTVLLTPEEHFEAHRLLAEYWKNHNIYGKKMLWAFHRLSYDGKRKLTKEQYGEARRVLQDLWKANKTLSHKEKISLAMKGNTNNSSRVFKGMKSDITEEGRKQLSEKVSKRLKGSKQWYGGPYTVVFEDGRNFTATSYPELSKLSGIKQSTLIRRGLDNKGKMIKGWKIE